MVSCLATHAQTDFGPFVSHTVKLPWPKNNLVLKGITIDLKINQPAPPPNPSKPPAKKSAKTDFRRYPTTQWLTIDLAKPATITRLRIKHGGTRESKTSNTRTFIVEAASKSTGPWREILYIPDNQQTLTQHKIKPTTARYFKLRVLQGEQNAAGPARIYAVEIYNKQNKNLALKSLGASATASGSCNNKEIPDYAIDSSDGTKWCAHPSTQSTIAAKRSPGKGNRKSTVIKGSGDGATIFDTELCRYAGVWTGDMITHRGTVFDGAHGTNPQPVSNPFIATQPTPGLTNTNSFKDPRKIPHGPLPHTHARYKGLYRHHNGIVLAYTLGQTQILDHPALHQRDGIHIFERTLHVGPSPKPIQLALCDRPNTKGALCASGEAVSLYTDKAQTLVHVKSDAKTTLSTTAAGRAILSLPPSKTSRRIKIAMAFGPIADQTRISVALRQTTPPADITKLARGGNPLWPKSIQTKGKRAKDNQAYVVDSIIPPFNNPYGSRMRIGGFDFFSDGRAAVSTWSGDVWIVSGIDQDLKNIQWKRYAAGLFHALGLKIVNDVIYVHGRDQITRLHDLNNDNEADFYECFNNDVMITQNFHEFAYDLHTDQSGNFYFVKGGPVRPGGRGWDKIVPHHGCVFKLSPDGKKLQVIARGLRAPNGIGVSPTGQITTGDNEGTWTPKCPINWVKKDSFLGVTDFMPNPKPTKRTPPLCWMPKNIDNSGGGQVWITSKTFGPLSGQLLHMSYGTCKLYRVLKEEVNGVVQGGVVPVPLRFDSGVCRARFHKKQNALYLTGLRGWQTRAARNGGFYRVRYTGKQTCQASNINFKPDGISLTFSQPLDRETAEDPGSFSIKQWNYRWASRYGSDHWSVKNPNTKGEDTVPIKSVKLSSDGKTVFIKTKIPLQPVSQIMIRYTIDLPNGDEVRNTFHGTINQLPKK